MTHKCNAPECSMADIGISDKEILARVAENIVKKNPAVKPHFQPYIKQPGIGFTTTMGFIHVDLKQFYPEAKHGNTAFVVTKMRLPVDSRMGILVNGKVKVWFNQECIFSSLDGTARGENGHEVILIDAVKPVTGVETAWYAEVDAKKDGENEVIIEAICNGETFEFDFNVSHPKNRTVWPTDYLIWTREESPLEELQGEEGMAVSPIYDHAQVAEEEFFKSQTFCHPVVYQEGMSFDLNQIFKEGETAIAYSEAIADGEISITARGPLKITINGRKVIDIKSGMEKIRCKKGDKIRIKCLKQKDNWGFSVENKRILGLSFVKMCEKRDLTFLFCGPFYEESFDETIEPEQDDCFSKIYTNEKGETIYWRFFPKDTFLRAYLNSCYYGQWFYAGMLCMKGLNEASKVLSCEEYEMYVYNAMYQMAEFAEYIREDKECYGSAAFMPYSMDMSALDNIGMAGVNFAEAYFKNANSIFLPVLERLKKGIDEEVSRFDDGTFCRKESNTMWADDLYMSCPFLMRMARYTGDTKYFDEAIAQINGFAARLYLPEEQIFSHIHFIKENQANRVAWGRANGWVVYAMVEVLSQLPQNYPGRQKVLELYRKVVEGICRLQDESGLWHQLLNRPHTYLETSCTAMFMLAILQGVKHGWLEEDYMQYAMRAWSGLKTYSIDKHGVVYGVCMGSSCSMEEKYYEKLPTVVDDDHGTGVVLAAISELCNMGS